MKNKKIIMYVAIIILILFIVGIGFLMINNNDNNNNNIIQEYTPAQEITDEQLRKTNIMLYFYDSINQKLVAEIRQIDSKELLENPEKKLIEYLIEGPKESELLKLIPEGTELINLELYNDILFINFSKEFILNENIDKNIIIESILKTVTQLNEINEIKILIEGKELENSN